MASRMNQQNLRVLKTERERIQTRLAEAQNTISSLQGELRGLERAIAICEGQESALPDASPPPEPHQKGQRRPRGEVKATVLDIVTERAEIGSKTIDVVTVAKERGIELDRNSVASLLSRLTREGVLTYDADTGRYRPAQKGGPTLRSVA